MCIRDSDNLDGFTGHIKDSDTGLNYMQARYYDPVIGRFLSVDPVGFLDTGSPSMFNRYAYSVNDPVNNIDPSGECVPGLCPNDIGMSVAAIRTDAKSFGVGLLRGLGASAANTATLGQMATGGGLTQVIIGNSASAQYANAIGPAENLSMAVGDMQGENLGNAAQAASPGGLVKSGTTAVAKTSIGPLTGFTKHGLNQAINRNVKPAAILDAVKNPLKVGPVKVDKAGRPSQRYTGGDATVAINPESGKAVSINPTSTKLANRLRRQNE